MRRVIEKGAYISTYPDENDLGEMKRQALKVKTGRLIQQDRDNLNS